jgi:hypothetical protein
MGRAQDIKAFLTGVAAGVVAQPLRDGEPEAWQDGWAEGRRAARELLAGYLESRGYAQLGDLTIQDMLH